MRATRHHDAVSSRWSWGALRALRMKTALHVLVGTLALLFCASQSAADSLAEYRIKAAFLANFVAFTEWPAEVGTTLNLCVYGPDPFGLELGKFQGRSVGGRSLAVTRVNSVDKLETCQIVFITRPVIDNLLRVLDTLSGKPVLTVADSPGAMRQGVALNLGTRQSRVIFEANLAAARGNGLNLSSKLLNLASEVRQ